MRASSQPPRRSRRRVRAALGLVELMVALAITAALLTATAVALDASIQAYQINIQQAAVLQAERSAMARIVSTIRRAKLHAPEDSTLSGQFAGGATVSGSGIAMFDAGGLQTTFKLDPATKTLNMITPSGTHPLLRGVETFQVTMEPMRSNKSVRTGGSWDLMKRATVVMTVGTTA